MAVQDYQDRYAAGGFAGVEVHPLARRRISWGAVFAGVIMALAVQILLAMLGVGVGLSTVDTATGDTPSATTLGIGAAIWWGVSYLVALFIGGYVAARLGGLLVSLDGALHGLLTWAFALIVSLYLLGTAVGSVVGGTFSVLSGTLSAAGTGMKDAVPQIAQAAGVTPDLVQQKAKELLSAQSTARIRRP